MKTYKILPLLFLLFSIFCGALFAQDDILVFLNGKELENVQAKMIDGHIMLPAKEIFEALGAKIEEQSTEYEHSIVEYVGENSTRRVVERLKVYLKYWTVSKDKTMAFHVGHKNVIVNTAEPFHLTYPEYFSWNNGYYVEFDAPIQLVDEKCFVPLKAIVPEVVGYTAVFSDEKKQVEISTYIYEETFADFEVKINEKYDSVYEIPDSNNFLAYKQLYDYTTQMWNTEMAKFDGKGNKIWSVNLADFLAEPYSGYTDYIKPDIDFVAYPDETFVAALGAHLVKFDPDGKIEWNLDLLHPIARKLFLTETGEIIALENMPKGEKKRGEHGYLNYDDGFNMVITRYSKNGEILAQKSFGGSGKSTVRFFNAVYTPELGLVVGGNTDAADGDFIKEDGVKYSSSFIVTCDMDNFDIKIIAGNINSTKSFTNFAPGYFVVVDGSIYTLFIHRPENTDASIDETVILYKLSAEGEELWHKEIITSRRWSPEKIVALENGRIAIYGYYGLSKKLFWFSPEGEMLAQKEIVFPDTDYYVLLDTLTFLDDGGFIIVTTHSGNRLMTAPYISSMPMDRKKIATKYNAEHKEIWQKLYYHYKGYWDRDMVLPLGRTGYLVVE